MTEPALLAEYNNPSSCLRSRPGNDRCWPLRADVFVGRRRLLQRLKPVLSDGGKIFEELSRAEQGARGREDKQRGEGVHQKMAAEPDHDRSHDEFAHGGR